MTTSEWRFKFSRRAISLCCGVVVIVCIGILVEVLDSRRIKPIQVDALIIQLGHPDIVVRHDAQRALIRMGKIPLLRALRDGNPDVRASAAHALGLLGDRETTKELVRALNDEYKYTRMWSAFSLGLVGDSRIIQSLLDRFYIESDPNVRVYIMDAFVRLGAEAAVPDIATELIDTDEYVVSHAVEAIVALANPDAIPHLLPLTNAADMLTRKAAVYCIWALDGNARIGKVSYPDALELAWTWWHSEGKYTYSKSN